MPVSKQKNHSTEWFFCCIFLPISELSIDVECNKHFADVELNAVDCLKAIF
ncbi:MAG: hypothetical protein IKC54_04610 [Clostridia bacterium]|nr:hypothetical protein [Clostridia bacterium]